MDYEHSELGTCLRRTQHYVWGTTPRITKSICMMRRTFLTSALDMPEIMSYIYSKSWKLQFSASSSIIIIEDYYLQTFLHSLIFHHYYSRQAHFGQTSPSLTTKRERGVLPKMVIKNATDFQKSVALLFGAVFNFSLPFPLLGKRKGQPILAVLWKCVLCCIM